MIELPPSSSNKQTAQAALAKPSALDMAALAIALIAAGGAASVLLTVPQRLEAAAQMSAAVTPTSPAAAVERPFHERYPIDAAAESIDSPTF